MLTPSEGWVVQPISEVSPVVSRSISVYVLKNEIKEVFCAFPSQAKILSVPHKIVSEKNPPNMSCRGLLHTQIIHSCFEIKYDRLRPY